MKLRFQQRERGRLGVSMTPLIDVVFLLMIFFLLTINFEEPERVLANRLPQIGVQNSDDPTQDWENVELRIAMVRGSDAVRLHLEERVLESYDELLGFLALLPDDVQIVIDAGNDVPYRHVIGVYNTCLKSGKADIVFSITT